MLVTSIRHARSRVGAKAPLYDCGLKTQSSSAIVNNMEQEENRTLPLSGRICAAMRSYEVEYDYPLQEFPHCKYKRGYNYDVSIIRAVDA